MFEKNVPVIAETKVNVQKFAPFEDGTLIKLYDMGHDSVGKRKHINVSYGMVDVRRTKSRFYRKNECGVWEGYQRVPTQKRITDITSDFTMTKLNPITVAVMNNSVEVIDGQGRDTAVKSLYKQGKIKGYYVPCVILENASDDDCASLFSKQYENSVYVDRKYRTKVEAANNDNETIAFLKRIVDNGLPVYDDETKEIHHSFNAIDTYKSVYMDFLNDINTFDRIIGVIASVWVTGETSGHKIAPKALQAEIIRGLAEMYKRYGSEINDLSFVKRLSKYTPSDILDTIIRNTPRKTEAVCDKKYKYIKTFVEIYNSSRQPKKLAY